MSIVKKRLSPEESRSAALEAARHILIEMGPAAVTLKAVAARIDRTHANLLHHFGSAAGLQKALAAYQAETVCATIGRKMAESAPGERNVREIVDLAFDAFNSGGAGALATWMAATGNDDALDPVSWVRTTLGAVQPPPAASIRVEPTCHRPSRVSTAARNGVACSMRMRIDNQGNTRSPG